MLKDIVNLENSIDFKFTQLLVKSVDVNSETEITEFAQMLQNKIDELTKKFPNAMNYIKNHSSIENGSFFTMCGLLSQLDITN